MAKLSRKTQLILGTSTTNEITQFATPNRTVNFTKDVETIQGIGTADGGQSWEEGWFNETQDGNYRPFAEDRNGVDYVVTSQLAYILQAGIPEWDSGTDYYVNCVVRYGNALYISITDNNLNHNPTTTDLNYWIPYILNAEDSGMVGEIRLFAGSSEPSPKWKFCRGQALNKNDYPDLYNVIMYSYGGSGNTFYLPDFRGYSPMGATASAISGIGDTSKVGVKFGSLNHTHTMPPHNHTALSNLSINDTGGEHTHEIIDAGHRHRINYKDGQPNTANGKFVSGYVKANQEGGDSGHMCKLATTGIVIKSSKHGHGAGSFTGWIGNSNGVSGDTSNPTSNANSPCMTINFIIKVAK